jgi:hypothetical protein
VDPFPALIERCTTGRVVVAEEGRIAVRVEAKTTEKIRPGLRKDFRTLMGKD